jgi:hypothetical protein
MCGKTTLLEKVAILGTGGLAAVPIGMKNQANAMQDAQNESIKKQDEAQAAAQKEAERLGPAAKSMDLTKEAGAYQDIKNNKIAMQNGIMGTLKTNPMAGAGSAATIKTTLGS